MLKKAQAYDGLARGLHETTRAIEKQQAQLCILADDCDQPDYKKLIEALCSEKSVPLLTVEDRETLGAMSGVSKRPVACLDNFWDQLLAMPGSWGCMLQAGVGCWQRSQSGECHVKGELGSSACGACYLRVAPSPASWICLQCPSAGLPHLGCVPVTPECYVRSGLQVQGEPIDWLQHCCSCCSALPASVQPWVSMQCPCTRICGVEALCPLPRLQCRCSQLEICHWVAITAALTLLSWCLQLCKIDADGEPRKIGKCSSVVITVGCWRAASPVIVKHTVCNCTASLAARLCQRRPIFASCSASWPAV